MKEITESPAAAPGLFAPSAPAEGAAGAESAEATTPQNLARGSGQLRSSALNTLLKGRYDLRRRIGSGGMAEVYLGWDLLLEREVAVKLLRDEFTRDAQQVARFRREAQMLARVDSNHVIQIYDMHFGRDECYLVLRHVIGRTLDRLVASNGPIGAPESLQIVADVLEGLAHLHEEGLVHRDVKPSNVLVGNDERAVLLDLGVACDLRKPHITPTNFTAGTPSYMAPEQKETGHVDERSDIYQAGLLLLFAVTTIEPARLTSPAFLEDVLLAVPDGVATIIERATSQEAGRRYRTAVEMRAAVLAVLDAANPSAEESSPSRPVLITIPPKTEAGIITLPEPAVSDTIEAAARAAADYAALADVTGEAPVEVVMLDTPKILEPETRRERPSDPGTDANPEMFDVVTLPPALLQLKPHEEQPVFSSPSIPILPEDVIEMENVTPVIVVTKEAKEPTTDPFAAFDRPIAPSAPVRTSGVKLLWSRGPTAQIPVVVTPRLSEQGMIPLARPSVKPAALVAPAATKPPTPRSGGKLRVVLLAAAVAVCVVGVSRKLEHSSTPVQEPTVAQEISPTVQEPSPPVTQSLTLPSSLPAAAAAPSAPTRAARVPVASPRVAVSPARFVHQAAEYERSGNTNSALGAYRSYLRAAPEGDQAGYVRIRVAELEAKQL